MVRRSFLGIATYLGADGWARNRALHRICKMYFITMTLGYISPTTLHRDRAFFSSGGRGQPVLPWYDRYTIPSITIYPLLITQALSSIPWPLKRRGRPDSSEYSKHTPHSPSTYGAMDEVRASLHQVDEANPRWSLILQVYTKVLVTLIFINYSSLHSNW